jgi:Fur family transcriptional regulator, ferric uptake regulator
MSAAGRNGWVEHALSALSAAGYRSGGARRQVIEFLGRQDCALTALEIDERLPGVGRASVYRVLEQLEELRLVQSLDVGREAKGYERVDPGGHHHHHIVCGRCGKVVPFEDRGLERAIASVSAGSGFEISGHEVTLRGRCAGCSRSAPAS